MLGRASLFTLLLLTIGLPATAQNAPVVRLDKTTINVSGLEPGSTAIILGASKEPISGAYMDRVEKWAVAVDDVRRDGTATFDVGKEIAAASVWAVVDARN